MEKYISLGIPCGKLDESAQYYILYRGNLYGMPLMCYALWNHFGCGSAFEAFSVAGDSENDNSSDLENGYADLKRLNLIVRLEDAIHYLPMRQGIGLGLNENNDGYAVQCGDAEVRLPFLCYFIWCYADGKTSILDIRQHLRKQKFDISDETFINAFYRLLMTEALALV